MSNTYNLSKKNQVNGINTVNTIETTPVSGNKGATMNKRVITRSNKNKVKIINTLVIASLLSTQVLSTQVMATSVNSLEVKTTQEQHQQEELNEEIGFGTGLVVGAIVGGPIGAFVAGIAGNFIAKHINANNNIENLTQTLTQAQLKHQDNLAHYQQEFEQKLQNSEQAYQAELLALEQNYKSNGQIQTEKLMMSLQFSTGSSEIAPHYQEQVAVLAQLLNSTPEMSIDLSGYTDLQGEESANKNLSLARVNAVKNLLTAQGVDETRILTFAYGEEAPVVSNAQQENSFYDRRVVLKLHNQLNQTAKNQ